MKKRKPLAKLMALVLSFVLLLPGMPAADTGCTHVHDGSCGYMEAAPCSHEHDQNCGWAEETQSGCTH